MCDGRRLTMSKRRRGEEEKRRRGEEDNIIYIYLYIPLQLR
jgi:hypothetical protein